MQTRFMQTLNLFHRSDLLHADAGTFFHQYYDDAERVYSLFDSLCWANQLLRDEALDASRLFYRELIPPVHRSMFIPVTVQEQDYREGRKKILVYGGQPVIRYGEDYYYGVPAALITGAVPLPETDGTIVDADLCCDLPVDPTVLLLKNEHFAIQNNHLVFLQDVFDLLPSEGNAPERTLTLWLRSVYSDRNYLQDRLGVLTQAQGSSSPEYAQFMNSIMDSVIGGSGYHGLTQLLCRLFDVPCTATAETVQQIGKSATGQWLATDRSVYRAPEAASFLYKIGDCIPCGTILTDAVLPISGKSFPEGAPLFLDRRFLGQNYIAGLIFPNEEVRLTMDGSRPVFPIIGRNEDVRRFWDTIYSHTTDRTFLTQSAIGGWINPAGFIYENALYPRARFYRIYTDKLGNKQLPMVNTKLFRELLLPGLLFDMLLIGATITLESPLPLQGHAERPASAMPPITFSVDFGSCEMTAKIC
jgi:hypothetical protein